MQNQLKIYVRNWTWEMRKEDKLKVFYRLPVWGRRAISSHLKAMRRGVGFGRKIILDMLNLWHLWNIAEKGYKLFALYYNSSLLTFWHGIIGLYSLTKWYTEQVLKYSCLLDLICIHHTSGHSKQLPEQEEWERWGCSSSLTEQGCNLQIFPSVS